MRQVVLIEWLGEEATRDATMILNCFRHGLRPSELCELQWSDVEFESTTLHLRRAKMWLHSYAIDEIKAVLNNAARSKQRQR